MKKWYEIDVFRESSGELRSLYFVDRSRISIKGNIATAWILHYEKKNDSDRIRREYTISEYQILCQKNIKIRVLSFFEYNSNGSVARTAQTSGSEWSSVVPESIGDSIAYFVCDLGPMPEMEVAPRRRHPELYWSLEDRSYKENEIIPAVFVNESELIGIIHRSGRAYFARRGDCAQDANGVPFMWGWSGWSKDDCVVGDPSTTFLERLKSVILNENISFSSLHETLSYARGKK